MRLRAIQRTDASLTGIWWDFQTGQRVPEPNANLCVRVAERDNPRHREVLARLQVEHVDALRKGGDDGAAAWKRIQGMALAEAILTDWRGLDDDDGSPLPYSVEKAREILLDPANWVFRHFVEDVSTTTKGYVAKVEEDAKGN